MLALMSNDVRGTLLLIGVVLFLVGAFAAWMGHKAGLVLGLLGLAVVFFPAMWDAFAA